jgi:hypothetical protein
MLPAHAAWCTLPLTGRCSFAVMRWCTFSRKLTLLAKGAGRCFGHVAKDAEGEVASGVEQAARGAGGTLEGGVCALSFAPDTPVATPSGEQPIAQVKPGDAVTAYDPSTGTATTQTVTATSIHHDDNLVDVTLQVTTPAAQASEVGQPSTKTTTATASRGTHASTSGSVPSHTSTRHTEVVHTTTNHPWLTADHGWLPAGFLHLGEPVRRADGSTATVVAVRVVPGAAAMWDLSVANVHTFAVGVGKYVVHNCGPGKWEPANESMSPRAAKYQAQITGRGPGWVYQVGGVKFDGFNGSVLQDAKGPGYARFFENGAPKAWWGGAGKLVNEARSQLAVSSGWQVEWHVAEEDAFHGIRSLLQRNGLTGIRVIHTPML